MYLTGKAAQKRSQERRAMMSAEITNARRKSSEATTMERQNSVPSCSSRTDGGK